MIVITVDLDGAGDELDRLARGPGAETVGRMEGALLSGFATTEGRVHVISGYLKSTLHPSSSFSGGEWEGTISAARYPGIYELARGNRPSKFHPDGQHYFFSAGPEFERQVRQAIWDWVTDDKGGPAPSGDLGWKSGGG